MKQVFPIIPSTAGSGMTWLLVGVVTLVCAIAIAAVFFVAYSAKRVRFEVGEGSLRIAGDLYGRTIRAEKLMVDQARTLNLDEDSDYRFRWRLNGSSFPGYRAGWFKLVNGEKALVFVTDRTHIVYVPTTENYSVMMSVADPQEFIGALKNSRKN